MTQTITSQYFYGDLPVFEDFRDIAALTKFHPLPDDWTLLIADVVGSTDAIERGAYKTVNMVGAASIICVLNVAGDLDLPFVFGGDGGLIAVPPSLLTSASEEMKRLQGASSSMFGLSLRAAAIPVHALRSEGADISVRKFQLSKGNVLAMFAGTGPTLADAWLKADETCRGYALFPDPEEPLPDLTGLSCRWEPLKSRNGTMLTIVALPTTTNDENTIGDLTQHITDVLSDRLEAFSPAHDATLVFRFPPKGLSLEIRAGGGWAAGLTHYWFTYFTALMQFFCDRFSLKMSDYDGAKYRDEIKSNTDFRKFDGALRLVIDVSEEEADEIESLLENRFRSGQVFYGTSRSDHALMTCLLFNLADSQHIHFIDGADGGYAFAAKALKQRMAQRDRP